jgi:multidrug efflux pump
MGSMLTATLFGIFFTPLFYVAARRWLSRKKRNREPDDDLSAPASTNEVPGGGPRDA